MGYVIAGILVLLIVTGLVTFLVLNATKKGGSDPKGEGTPGIGSDETPLGDTSELAGEQTSEGTTVGAPEGDERPSRSGAAPAGGQGGVGGEGEGGRPVDTDSERLANRPR